MKMTSGHWPALFFCTNVNTQPNHQHTTDINVHCRRPTNQNSVKPGTPSLQLAATTDQQ